MQEVDINTLIGSVEYNELEVEFNKLIDDIAAHRLSKIYKGTITQLFLDSGTNATSETPNQLCNFILDNIGKHPHAAKLQSLVKERIYAYFNRDDSISSENVQGLKDNIAVLKKLLPGVQGETPNDMNALIQKAFSGLMHLTEKEIPYLQWQCIDVVTCTAHTNYQRDSKLIPDNEGFFQFCEHLHEIRTIINKQNILEQQHKQVQKAKDKLFKDVDECGAAVSTKRHRTCSESQRDLKNQAFDLYRKMQEIIEVGKNTPLYKYVDLMYKVIGQSDCSWYVQAPSLPSSPESSSSYADTLHEDQSPPTQAQLDDKAAKAYLTKLVLQNGDAEGMAILGEDGHGYVSEDKTKYAVNGYYS